MGGKGDMLLRQRLLEIIRQGGEAGTPQEPPPAPPEPPAPPALPLAVLPEPLRAWAEALAEAMAVPSDYVVAGILGAAAGALGGTCRLELEPGWVEAPRLWVALVGAPGAGKSPVLQRIMAPLWEAHRAAVDAFNEDWEAYQQELAAWEAERDEWRKKGRGTEPPPKPEPPAKRWLVVTDTTREALVSVLKDNPPGILVFADELAGLVRDWTRYRDDGGRQAWLALWSGAPLHVERKGSGHVFVAEPFVALLGGIQPRVVRAVAPLDGDDGLLARFLLACPNPAPVPDAFPPAPDGGAWRAVVERLLACRDKERTLRLTPAAAACFNELRRWAMREAREQGDELLAAVLAKLPSQAARVSLILAGLEAACAGATVAEACEVGEAAVAGAWALVRAFVDHTARALGEARMTPEDRRAAAVLRWLHRKGGQATPREVARANVAGITRASEAEAVLRDLVDQGFGRFERQGRARVFRLARPGDEAVDGVA